jgi:hypothetical protein
MTKIHYGNEGLNPMQPPALRAKPVAGFQCVPSEMQVASLHISSARRNGKSTHTFDGASRPSRGASAPGPGTARAAAICCSARPHAYEVFRRAVDIDDFVIPAAVAGEPGPLKYMRRDRDRDAPQLDHPCEEFLDRRPCFAVGQIRRGQRQVRRARFSQETHLLAADRGALYQPGLLMPCQVFSNALLCSTAARQSAATTEAHGGAATVAWVSAGLP